MNDVIKEWTEKGWSQVRVHGVEGNFTRQGTLMNEKAQSIGSLLGCKWQKEKPRFILRIPIIICSYAFFVRMGMNLQSLCEKENKKGDGIFHRL